MATLFKEMKTGEKFRFYAGPDYAGRDTWEPFVSVRLSARTYKRVNGETVYRVGSINAKVCRIVPDTVSTFCANLKRAINDCESVHLGGGTFSPDELREILEYLKGENK